MKERQIVNLTRLACQSSKDEIEGCFLSKVNLPVADFDILRVVNDSSSFEVFLGNRLVCISVPFQLLVRVDFADEVSGSESEQDEQHAAVHSEPGLS